MAMTLYHGEPNGPSLTVLAALFETGAEAELAYIDLARGERHRLPFASQPEVAMSIEGEGPVLARNDEAMTDSVFIACFLNDIGDGAIVPADPYARWEMMTWCRYIIERIAPAAAFLGAEKYLSADFAEMDESDFEEMIGAIQSDDLKARWRSIRAGDFPVDKREDSKAKIATAVQKIEAQLSDGRDWLMGDFSIADLETCAWIAGMQDIVPEAFENRPQTLAWLERVSRRPSVAEALQLAKTDDPRASWAPGPEINRWG